jgi:hypothetical protein
MEPVVKLILGSFIALTLGLAAASPLLIPNLALTTTIQLEIDTVYAYISIQQYDPQITGLWRNYSNLWENDLHIISYLFIINVTNPTDKLLMLGEFTASGAPQIDITQFPRGELSVGQTNPIVTAFRDLSRYYPGWSQYWQPNSSRLIALSGTIENSNTAAHDALQTGTIYLFARVEGKTYEGGWAKGYNLKQVQLQQIGNEYLYNILLNQNQILRLTSDGIDAYIETRR